MIVSTDCICRYNLRREQVDAMQSFNSVAQRIVLLELLLETPVIRLLLDNEDEMEWSQCVQGIDKCITILV